MEEKKKKKKLTLTTSSKKPHSVSHYAQNVQSKGKTSVVIEKKLQEDGVKKNSSQKIVLASLNQRLILYLKKRL